MRWFWIDRFTEFVAGERAVAIKHVALAEPQLHDNLPGYPYFPPSLIVEGMAQTGGLLLGERTNFQMRLVLAKISRARFHFLARPGDTLRYTASLERAGPEGARIQVHSQIDDRRQAEADIFLAVLPERLQRVELFNPAEFARLLRVLRIHEVARTPDGEPLRMPITSADEAKLGSLPST